jgi:DNA-binding NarL/FixJ family response regulator
MKKKNAKNMLSEREKQIAQMICDGKTNRMISEHLILSIDTVNTHRKNIFRKLDVHCIAELVRVLLNHREYKIP